MAGNSTKHNLIITQTIAITIWHNKKASKMGYFVGTEEVNIFLDKKHFEDVYKKMCELNDYDDLKRGGQFGGNDDPVEGDKYNRNKWFSWMSYNYPETCPDMKSIFDALGIELTFDDNGNLTNLGYWDKTGSEDYFLSCLAGYVEDGSFINWKGEESEDYYQYYFKDGKMIVKQAVITFDYESKEPEVYHFGQMSESDKQLDEWRKKIAAQKEIEEVGNG